MKTKKVVPKFGKKKTAVIRSKFSKAEEAGIEPGMFDPFLTFQFYFAKSVKITRTSLSP